MGLTLLRLLEARLEVPGVPDGAGFRAGERLKAEVELVVVSAGEYAGVEANDLVLVGIELVDGFGS